MSGRMSRSLPSRPAMPAMRLEIERGDAQVAVGRLQRLAAVLVGAQLRLERLLDLRRRAAGLDPAVVVGPVGADREARLLQVGADRGHVGVGRRVAGAELVGRQVLAVAGARRVRRRRDGGVERLGVAHAQVDPEGVLGAVGNGPDLGIGRGPVRCAVGQGGAARARGSLRGGRQSQAGRRRRALPAVRWNGARDYLRQRMEVAVATLRLPAVRCPPRRPHTHAPRFLRSVVGRDLCESGRSLGCRADARADREPQPRRGRRHQAQADRRVRRPREHRRGAPERRAHALARRAGSSPASAPTSTSGRWSSTARCASSTRPASIDVPAEQAILVRGGEWVRYSTPYPGGAEYVAVCLPAFSPDTVHRDDDDA